MALFYVLFALVIIALLDLSIRVRALPVKLRPWMYRYRCPACRVTLIETKLDNLHQSIAKHAYNHGMTRAAQSGTIGVRTSPTPKEQQ